MNELSPKMQRLVAVVDVLLSKYANSWQLIDYKSLAEEAGGYSPRNKYLAEALGIVSTMDFQEDRPMRSCLVIRSDTFLPGSGFFTLYDKLKGMRDKSEKTVWFDEYTSLLRYVFNEGY